ncbi:YgfZ/GcvT domain-containing protein [Aquimonas sp.]|jgi:folate-binding protein YgfZ|uniref:CAF17-like 4Fe-4S cluster assembly/insertion protein YgfZ n=1 Tax=Aquimonas sp. TaxID=1872588 RepID=UPI0037C13C61
MQGLPEHPYSNALRGLPEFTVLAVEGSDSLAFAQSQFSNDANALQPGDWQWSAWLNAKGRVLALFALLRRPDEDGLWLLLPDHPAELLAPALSRFVLRRKCRVQARTDLQVYGRFLSGVADAPGDAVACLRMRGEPTRELFVLPVAVRAAESEPVATTEWLRADIRQGVPRLPAEGGSHTAHMLGLDRLEALSLSKGCYPGQEIVARTHYLGQSKRRLGGLRTPLGPAPAFGASVLADTMPCGDVISASTHAHGVEIQAVLSDAARSGALSIDGVPAERVELGSPPLPDLAA